MRGEPQNRMALEPDTSVPRERNRPDYDADAVAESRSAAKVDTSRSTCGRCHKAIFREPSYPGVPSEWRHVSSGHPVSWLPVKHSASLTGVGAHVHRFPQSLLGSSHCTTEGCDAELRAYTVKPVDDEDRSEREKADDVSRKRGSLRGHVTQGHKKMRF